MMQRPPGEAELALEFNIAEATIERLGPLLLTASINGAPLASQEYRQAGPQRFVWRLTASGSGDVAVHFHLSKFLKRGAVDQRELGIIVKSVGISKR